MVTTPEVTVETQLGFSTVSSVLMEEENQKRPDGLAQACPSLLMVDVSMETVVVTVAMRSVADGKERRTSE